MDGNSDMEMTRQAMLQTWIDLAQARKARQRREWMAMGAVALFCLLVVFSRSLFG